MSGNAQVKTQSKIGRKPIPVPSNVDVAINYREIVIKGPKGTLTQKIHSDVVVNKQDQEIIVERYSERKFHRSLHGLTRSLIANAITGVTEGYQRSLEVMGVGYRAQQSGQGIILNVGFSHIVEMHPPDGVTVTVEGNNKIHVEGMDKQKVGLFASKIRKIRPPNPYKEKGIKYADEIIRLKPGKAAAKKA